ncbi:MAG: substrate-binding domain-containing protein [Planctomycetota bacterium]
MIVAAPPQFKQVKPTPIRHLAPGQKPVGLVCPSASRRLEPLGVSRPTLVRASRELADEGFLYRKRGQGTFIASAPRPAKGGMPEAHVTVFISRDIARLTGAGREVQLKILRGVQAALGASYNTSCVREVVAGELDPTTLGFIESSPRGVALIVEPSSICPALMEWLANRDWVVWSVNEPCDNGNHITIDQEQAGYLATRHLLGQGRRRLALINGPEEAYWGFKARREGYERALRQASVQVVPEHICQSSRPIDSEAGRMMMRSLLESGRAFDGVVAASDAKAIGAIAETHDAKIDVPSEIAFVSIDNTLAEGADSPLPAVAMPFEELGYQAAIQAQSSAMRSHRRHPVNIKVCLQPYLVER